MLRTALMKSVATFTPASTVSAGDWDGPWRQRLSAWEARDHEKEECMRNHLREIIALAVLALGTPANGAAQTSQANGETYTWMAELVSADAATHAVTVRARVAYQDALADLKRFKAGEPVWVLWSGVHDYSDAVRQIRRPEPHGRIGETLMLPAELVSPEAPNQYVTIRVKVPEGSLAALKTVKPGEWITVTSRQRPATDSEAVIAVKPYNSSTATTNTTT